MSGKLHPPLAVAAADGARSRVRTDREPMMRFFSAQVRGGRLTLDESTDLPDGTIFELISTDDVLSNGGDLFNVEQRAELDRELGASMAEAEAGETIDLADVLSDLKARH